MQIYIGNATEQLGETKFFLDSTKHAAVFGKSGVGKSSLLNRTAVEIMRAGQGLTFIDPHGASVDTLLNMVPKDRMEDVILFDPSLPRVTSFNILEGRTPELALDTLITIVKNLWPDGWGPRTDQLITAGVLAVLELEPKPTVVHVHKFFSNSTYRARVLRKSRNPLIKDFEEMFEHEWDKRQRSEATAAPANKFAKFLVNPALRLVLGGSKSLDLKEVMDHRRILFVKIPKGSLGADVAQLIGSVIVSKLMLAALSREGQRERPPHLLIVDEVSNFTKGIPLDVILSEARKYNLTLLLAAQTLSQLPEPAAVFGNSTTILSYRLGGKDAKDMAEEFGGGFPPSPLLNRPNYTFYGITVKGAQPVGPYTVTALPPIERRKEDASKKTVIARSQANWMTDKHRIESQIDKSLKH